jgi:hypothetical protein
VNKILAMIVIDLVAPKAGAKHELFQQTEAGLLNKSLCLTPALSKTKVIIVTNMIWVTLCCAA